MRYPVCIGICRPLTRRERNSRKGMLFRPVFRSHRLNDPDQLKRARRLAHLTHPKSNTTKPKSSSPSTSKELESSSLTSKELGSSSKEEDAPNDEAESEIPT
ncbi:hypothetical protein HA466_0185400 [Hirschfeldia incana]|nr:hypothetical protein HA466_0185400 [Hirschfeldia incana]